MDAAALPQRGHVAAEEVRRRHPESTRGCGRAPSRTRPSPRCRTGRRPMRGRPAACDAARRRHRRGSTLRLLSSCPTGVRERRRRLPAVRQDLRCGDLCVATAPGARGFDLVVVLDAIRDPLLSAASPALTGPAEALPARSERSELGSPATTPWTRYWTGTRPAIGRPKSCIRSPPTDSNCGTGTRTWRRSISGPCAAPLATTARTSPWSSCPLRHRVAGGPS